MKRIFAYSPSKFLTQMVELVLKDSEVEVFTYNDLAEALAQLPQLLPHNALVDLEGAADGHVQMADGLAQAQKVLWVGAKMPADARFVSATKPFRPLALKAALLS